MSRYSYLREQPPGPSQNHLRHELIVLLGLLATATDDEIVEAVRARGASSRTVDLDRKYLDAIYGRLEDVEAEQQRLVRALREKGVIT
jgi:hypothetical protein